MINLFEFSEYTLCNLIKKIKTIKFDLTLI